MVEHAHVTNRHLLAGLALDDAVVRVVVLDGAGEAPTVVEAAEADLAPGIVADGRVRDNAALGRRIGELWRALDLGGVATFLGLQPLDAHVGRVAVSRWPESGPAPEVLAEVAALRAAYGDEVVWSAAPACSPGGGEEARLAVCRREDISSAVWALRRTGVRVTGVELAGLALERALALIAPGSGLAAGSPLPVASCAVALGLALGAAGIGAAPLELQACLLNSGVRQMQTRLASVSLRSLASPSARDLLWGGPTRRSAGIGPEQSRLFKPRAVPEVAEVAGP